MVCLARIKGQPSAAFFDANKDASPHGRRFRVCPQGGDDQLSTSLRAMEFVIACDLRFIVSGCSTTAAKALTPGYPLRT